LRRSPGCDIFIIVSRPLAILAACLALLSAATSQGRQPRMYADYQCWATSELAAGKLSVTRWLGPDGALSSTIVGWAPVLDASPDLTMMAHWEAHPPEVINLDHGLVMFDQKFDRSPGSKMPRNGRGGYRLELRAQPGPSWDGYARLEGTTSLQGGVRLSADWADVAAMARGAGAVILVLKDRKGAVVSRQRLDRSLFEGFPEKAKELLETTAGMTKDFRVSCRDMRANGDIVL
jgi:hypothetical protein